MKLYAFVYDDQVVGVTTSGDCGLLVSRQGAEVRRWRKVWLVN